MLSQAKVAGERSLRSSLLCCFVLASFIQGCEGEPTPSSTTPEPQQALSPLAPEPSSAPEGMAPKGEESSEAPESEKATTPSANEVFAPKAASVVDRSARQALLVAHYTKLQCLVSQGADDSEHAKAFSESGLAPELWGQALAELLQALEEDPGGELAQRLAAIAQSPCAEQVAP